MSQAHLGDAVGVSFQHIQKYERAQNRVAASTLLRVATVPKRDISYFFTDAENSTAQVMTRAWARQANEVQRFDVDIVRLLAKIDDNQLKRGIVALLEPCSDMCASVSPPPTGGPADVSGEL